MPGAIIDNGLEELGRAPPKVVGSDTKRVTRPSVAIPDYILAEAKIDKRDTFDPKKHLDFAPPKNIITMKEIGLEGQGISPHAVSEPFPLFNAEAIKQMRAEIFSEESMEHCRYSSTFNANMVRGMGHARAPFTYDAWHNPEVLAKLSEVAGIEVVPALDFDIANINISINDKSKEIVKVEQKPTSDEDLPTVAWHYDSFPFVCVMMMSDCTDMVGGETALRTTTGEIRKVRGPAMGTAVILQGRYIEHQALKALGGRERITMVTSLRPKSAFVKDETVLTGVRGISPLTELYTQYTEYRLEALEERIREKLKTERRRELANRPYDIPGMRKWLAEQRQWLDAMIEEIHEVNDD